MVRLLEIGIPIRFTFRFSNEENACKEVKNERRSLSGFWLLPHAMWWPLNRQAGGHSVGRVLAAA